MIVVLDTNAVVQMFGARSPLAPLKDALVRGRLHVAISTGMWLEYEEVIVRYWEPDSGLEQLNPSGQPPVLVVEESGKPRL